MIRFELQRIVQAVVDGLISSGALPSADYDRVEIVDTKQPEHGDFACNFALTASKKAGRNPRELGEMLAKALVASGEVFAGVEVAGPGFVNLRLQPAWIAGFVAEVLAEADLARAHRAENPLNVNIEFVSVNPNGPITIGSGRGAAYGSTLANVLEAAGHGVHREYYINDGVNSEQMRLFAESVRAILLGKPIPENGYKGDFVVSCATQVKMSFNVENLQTMARGQASSELSYKGNYDQSASAERRSLMYRDLALHALQASNPLNILPSLSTEYLQRLCESSMVSFQGFDLKEFGVEFDTWFSEQSLHDSGKVEESIGHLEQTGAADYEPYRTKLKLAKGGKIEEVIRESQVDDEHTPTAPEGEGNTLWLRSTKFGDDMDRVLRRRDGRLTYISSDVSYHEDKFNRGDKAGNRADRLITILGPDHHGYIGRLQAVLAAQLLKPVPPATATSREEGGLYRSPEEEAACHAALAEAKEKLEVQIYQLVRFLKDGKPAPMRKRDGNIYALIDLIDEIGKKVKPSASQEEQRKVGKDVARFFYLMRSHDTTFDFDLDLAEKQSDENPVFYVQYAYARICSILRKAEGEGDSSKAALLSHPKELELIKKICDLPWEVGRCAEDYGVHRLTTYAIELARTFHHFYDACRVIQDDQPELTQARLALCTATQHALKSTLNLLGVEAPERMEREG